MKRILYLFSVILMLFTLTSCDLVLGDGVTTTKIEVSEDSTLTFLYDEVNINKIKIVATLSNKDTRTITVTANMISDADKEKLKKEGSHEITITYQGQTVKTTINVVKEFGKVVVSFVTNNETTIDEIEVETMSKLKEPAALTKEGYTFKGWYLDPEFKTKWNFETSKVTSKMTLYALWETKKVTVTFKSEISEDTVIEVEYGKSIVDLPKVPYKRGYIGSWEKVDLTNITEDKEVNAIYSIDDISVDDYILSMSFSNQIESSEELSYLLDYIKLNKIETYKVTVNFAIDNLNVLIDETVGNTEISMNVNFHFSMLGPELTITSTFSNDALESADNQDRYTQIESVEVVSFSSREDDFDDFNINKVTKTYQVRTTEQLYYVLEKGYRPIFSEENTEAERIYNKAKAVLKTIISDDDNDIEKLHKIYHYIIMNVTYDATLFNAVIENPNADLSNYKGFYLEGVFDDNRAVCDGISKAFLVLANIEGITCVQVTGKAKEGGYGHAWNKVRIDGKWYNIDPTGGGLIVGDEEILVHNLFLISDEKILEKYTIENYTKYIALESYNIYKNLSYSYLLSEYDYNITSKEELKIMIDYYLNLNNKESSIDFKIDFDYGTSLDDEIAAAFVGTKVSSYSKVLLDDVLVLTGYETR